MGYSPWKHKGSHTTEQLHFPLGSGPGWAFRIWTQSLRQTFVPEELAGDREVRGARARPCRTSEATWTLTAHLTEALDWHDSRTTPLTSPVVLAMPREDGTCKSAKLTGGLSSACPPPLGLPMVIKANILVPWLLHSADTASRDLAAGTQTAGWFLLAFVR